MTSPESFQNSVEGFAPNGWAILSILSIHMQNKIPQHGNKQISSQWMNANMAFCGMVAVRILPAPLSYLYVRTGWDSRFHPV
jgi:hypothetical protein